VKPTDRFGHRQESGQSLIQERIRRSAQPLESFATGDQPRLEARLHSVDECDAIACIGRGFGTELPSIRQWIDGKWSEPIVFIGAIGMQGLSCFGSDAAKSRFL